METPISKSQIRAARIAGIAAGDSYETAKAALEAAGLRGDAIPAGGNWRSAAKLSDSELIAAIRTSESTSDWRYELAAETR